MQSKEEAHDKSKQTRCARMRKNKGKQRSKSNAKDCKTNIDALFAWSHKEIVLKESMRNGEQQACQDKKECPYESHIAGKESFKIH